MARLFALFLVLAVPAVSANSIYRTTDADGNVVFTDAPPADGSKVESVGVQRTNTAAPPQHIPQYQPGDDENTEAKEAEKAPLYNIVIASPANETTIPMGPGNFSVTVLVEPDLEKYESLQLFVDDTPRGSPQLSPIWDLTNVFRGAHDITVGVLNREGEILAMSDPVRVYVLRPSINFRNRP